jgi:RimJ/RimL family protein N-acetyltransferase
VISPSRVALVPLSITDISEEYLETLNDRKYMRYSRNSRIVHTFESQLVYVSSFVDSNNLLYGIKDLGTDKIIGTINCYIDFSTKTLDLGFLVFKNHQGKGYASEGLGLLLVYLKQQFPGMIAVIGTNRLNLAMQEIARKHGFKIDNYHEKDSDVNVRFLLQFPRLDLIAEPFVPDLLLDARRIGVVAHDAGGAEQIKWLLQHLSKDVRILAAGPAVKIFENLDTSYVRVQELHEVMDCDLLITGSGWMSDLELVAIKEAKSRNLTCVTTLDHWVNFEERFRGDLEGSPIAITVTNQLALKLAQDKFPSAVVWLLPDFQIQNFQKKLEDLKTNPDSVLVLLEPISSISSQFQISEERVNLVLDSSISMKNEIGLKEVVIRLHPSDLSVSLIEQRIAEHPGVFRLSEKTSLVDDLEASRVVIGLSTYALYISTMCGIDTYSVFAGEQGHWTSQYPRILKLNPHPFK